MNRFKIFNITHQNKGLELNPQIQKHTHKVWSQHPDGHLYAWVSLECKQIGEGKCTKITNISTSIKYSKFKGGHNSNDCLNNND